MAVIDIYIDVLFMINFTINLLIVESCGLLAGQRTKWQRSLLSAGAGALYAVLVFFPRLTLLTTMVAKILISGLMVAIAYNVKRKSTFFKLWCSFYLVSFIFGGALIAVISLSGIGRKTGAVISNGSIYFSLPWKIVLLSSACVYFMITVFSKIRKKRISGKAVERSLKIYINGEKVEMNAIIDTGNSLSDPITGCPVIICEYDKLKRILPKGEQTLAEKMVSAGMRVRMIPFSSIGEEKGVIPGFMPDLVEIDQYKAKRCVVCISETKLSKEEEYHALLNPMVIVG